MAKVNGTVIELKSKGLNFPSIARVEYEVDGKKYQIEETIKLANNKAHPDSKAKKTKEKELINKNLLRSN